MWEPLVLVLKHILHHPQIGFLVQQWQLCRFTVNLRRKSIRLSVVTCSRPGINLTILQQLRDFMGVDSPLRRRGMESQWYALHCFKRSEASDSLPWLPLSQVHGGNIRPCPITLISFCQNKTSQNMNIEHCQTGVHPTSGFLMWRGCIKKGQLSMVQMAGAPQSC